MAAPSPLSAVYNLITAGLAWHRTQLRVRPYTSNMLTGGSLMAAGDRLAQALERSSDAPLTAEQQRRSWLRTGILATWSMGVGSPWWTWYYRTIDRLSFGARADVAAAAARATGLAAAVSRVVHDRYVRAVLFTAVVPAPVFNAMFFSFATASEHLATHASPLSAGGQAECVTRIEGKLRDRWLPTVITSAQVWIPMNYVNFRYVPMDYRNLVASTAALLWNVFLSLQQHRRVTAAAPGTAAAAAAPVDAAAAAAAAAAAEELPASSMVGGADAAPVR